MLLYDLRRRKHIIHGVEHCGAVCFLRGHLYGLRIAITNISRLCFDTVWLQDPQGSVVAEGSELSAVVTEIADVTAGPEEGSIALAKRVYAHLYEGNLNSRYCLLTIHSPAWPLATDWAEPCVLTKCCDLCPAVPFKQFSLSGTESVKLP